MDTPDTEHTTDESQNISQVLEKFIPQNISEVPGEHAALTAADAQMHNLRVRDNSWKLSARQEYGSFFTILLIAQNMAVFGIVIYCIKHDKLENLQPILSILITATLTETYFIIRIMVQWMFADIDYKRIS
ncbi:MAG: hypothetical protein JST49_03225 [Bacteroidetes bacterium]|nr:hypothetical protein [Bacteroidota bacterium]